MQTEHNNTAAVGLDVGTSRIVAARREGDRFQFKTQLNAFLAVPFSKMTAGMLSREAIPYTAAEDRILIHGNDAERFADLLNTEMRRPMLRGTLNPGEPGNTEAIGAIAELVAGKPAARGQRLYFSVPAPPLGGEDHLTYHEAALTRIFEAAGFEAHAINEGLAVIYSELESTNYTGIGISCGGGLCNACFAYLSVPVFSFSIPKAGDFIDASAAAVLGERANRVRIAKEESFSLNGHFPTRLHQVMSVYYDDVIRTLVKALGEAFTSARSVPKVGRAVPIVLSGGTALPAGFRERFEEVLRASRFPIGISEVRLAAEPLTATAKGALAAALCE